MIDLMEIGARLKELRTRLNIKQDDFADSLNTSKTTLSQYENGNTRMKVDFLFDLSRIYNVNLNYLVRGEGEPFIERRVDPAGISERRPFGKFTIDIEKMLWNMEHSNLVLSAFITMAKEYIYRNRDIIEKDIADTAAANAEEKKRKRP